MRHLCSHSKLPLLKNQPSWDNIPHNSWVVRTSGSKPVAIVPNKTLNIKWTSNVPLETIFQVQKIILKSSFYLHVKYFSNFTRKCNVTQPFQLEINSAGEIGFCLNLLQRNNYVEHLSTQHSRREKTCKKLLQQTFFSNYWVKNHVVATLRTNSNKPWKFFSSFQSKSKTH